MVNQREAWVRMIGSDCKQRCLYLLESFGGKSGRFIES